MSQEDVEVVRRIYDAWNERAISTLNDLFDEQVELRLNVVMGRISGVRASASSWPISWLQLLPASPRSAGGETWLGRQARRTRRRAGPRGSL